MKITTIGIDLAKAVFQLHGVDAQGKVVLRKQIKRDQMAAFFAGLMPCLIGMEACGSAHFWARKLHALGHTVRLMAPQFVKPYVKTNKNDMADAEAICEAVTRPNMLKRDGVLSTGVGGGAPIVARFGDDDEQLREKSSTGRRRAVDEVETDAS